MVELEKDYHKGVRWSLLGSAGTAFFQFLQVIVFARMAPPEAMGDYILAIAFLVFVLPLAEAGLGQALVQRPEVDGRHTATLLSISLVLAGLLYALLYAVAPLLTAWFERPALGGLLRLMGLSLCLAPITMVYSGWLTRQLRFSAVARIEIAGAAAGFMVVLAGSIAGAGAWAMAGGYLIRTLAVALGSWWEGRRLLPFSWRHAAGWTAIQPFLKAGVLDIGVRWTDFLSNYLDKLIVGKFLGAAALGHYNLAYNVLTLPTARLGNVIARTSFPAFARIQHDPTAVQEFFQKTGRQLVLLLLPLYLILIVMAPELIRLVYGPQWGMAAAILPVLALGGFMRSSGVLVPQMAKGLGRMRALFTWVVLWAAALVFTLLVAINVQPELETVAWSRALPELTIGLVLVRWLANQCSVRLQPVLISSLRLSAWLAPWMLLVYFSGYLTEGWFADLLLKSVIAATATYMLLFRSRFSEEYRGLLRSLLP